MKKINPQQIPLTGMETHLCECGCGNYFMRRTTGNKQRYVNKTHKKRALRARERLSRTDTRVRLAPLGYLYIRTENTETAKHLWAQMDPAQQTIIKALCDTGLHAAELDSALKDLFGRKLH